MNSAPEVKNPIINLLPEINAALSQAMDARPGCPEQLLNAMQYMLLAPGKRLRPALVLMAAEAAQCDRRLAIPAAVAVEMIHTYSLIHDDLPAMDDDDLRRGQPSCHIQFDEATAILAGDALLAGAFEELAKAELPPLRVQQAIQVLAQSAGKSNLVGGQMDDLLAESNSVDHTLELLESIHHRKTGALFRVSLKLGGVLAGANQTTLDSLGRYATHLGLAFQIVDDLLDWNGEQQTIGKRSGKDAIRGKLTYPGLLGEPASRERANTLVEEAKAEANKFGMHGRRLVSLAEFVLSRSY